MTATRPRTSLSRQPWHPFLFALYPILALAAANLEWVRIEEIGRAAVASLGAAVLLLLLFRVLLKNWAKAALLTSGYLLLFFGYGHIVRAVESLTGINSFLIKQLVAALYAAVLIFATWWVWRVLKRDIGGVMYFLNIVVAVALILPIYNIAVNTLRILNRKPHL
jgi:hypothetical protein